MKFTGRRTVTAAGCAVGLIAFLGLCSETLAGAAEMRIWTSSDGREIEAEFVGGNESSAMIRRSSDGRRFTIPLASLSEADREYVAGELARRAAPKPVEATGPFAGKVTGEWEPIEFESLKVRFFASPELNGNVRHPALIFLHGRGSGGTDNEKQLGGHVRQFADGEVYEKYPCFVLVPQCPDDNIGWREQPLADVIKLIESAIENLPADEDRIYITGLSMGGYGTFAALAEAPKLFAAGVPVCGGGNPATARDLKKIPIWVHHGADDDVVPADQSRRMVEALEDERGSVKYTEYPGVKHNAWDPCYSDPKVWDWLFAQKRGEPMAGSEDEAPVEKSDL